MSLLIALTAGKEATSAGVKALKDGRIKDIALEQGLQSSNSNYNAMRDPNGRPTEPSTPRSITASITNAFLRFLQFIFALTVAGLYGKDLQHACDKDVYLDAKWVYAEVVAALAAFTAAMDLMTWCFVPRVVRRAVDPYQSLHLPFLLWEVFICLIWLVLFGVFAKMYLSEDPEGDGAIERMRHATWIDLVNLLLWVVTMVWSGMRLGKDRFKCGGGKKAKKEKDILKKEQQREGNEFVLAGNCPGVGTAASRNGGGGVGTTAPGGDENCWDSPVSSVAHDAGDRLGHNGEMQWWTLTSMAPLQQRLGLIINHVLDTLHTYMLEVCSIMLSIASMLLNLLGL
ncbi:conserved hypothetical protein [Talaromyces stipitatus ATCC 10500]|uniref:MARVEL domain-containing protein n=1 Tax=Talaromyces stipitatus (strain ATCC 10500 / CBS 375.48 / QM 6759 / NRRL 1006) TaxID=441959 RepID=B8MCY1_TALSN|nr:uncharacterized protein TSTA_113330 [Talaromyces stipitatus ATCC 10500]EED17507.1 conserved hypothetical protein [Talaromyces stipitatus ATCC 10500]